MGTTFSDRRGWRARLVRGAAVVLASLVALLASIPLGRVTAAPAAGAADWSPVLPSDFPDPSVLAWNGAYYAFATQSTSSTAPTTNIQVATSADGLHWTLAQTDALPALPSWATAGDTWAPSVAYDRTDDEFVMYYTATEASTGSQCIGVATAPAADPTGPYHDTSSAPVVCQDGGDAAPTIDNGDYGGSIDPDVFTDSAGNSWLIWKSDGNHVGDGTVIWSVPLAPDLQSPTSTAPTELLTDEEPWQDGVVEGPDMVETPAGGYDLFYSGNDAATSAYGIGWASCPSGPSVPCTDQSVAGPLLGTEPGMSGPGSPDVYTLSASGETLMAFSAWQGTTTGFLGCGIRPMYLAQLSFEATGTPSLAPALATGPAANPPCATAASGYWQVGADGGVFAFGNAGFYGSTGSLRLNRPVVGMAATPDHRGYWLVASDGGVFAFGDAGFYGSTGGLPLRAPVIGMLPTLDGRGYWLIAADGGVFAFGDAIFYGSAAGLALDSPVTGAASSFLAGGYWLVDANGQVYSFGNAPYEGQPASAPGGYRIVGMAPTHDDNGYWLASANGNVATFGDAAQYGSEYGVRLAAPIVGMAATGDGGGYWVQGADGGIFAFGDAPFYGSMGGRTLNAPMVGIAID